MSQYEQIEPGQSVPPPAPPPLEDPMKGVGSGSNELVGHAVPLPNSKEPVDDKENGSNEKVQESSKKVKNKRKKKKKTEASAENANQSTEDEKPSKKKKKKKKKSKKPCCIAIIVVIILFLVVGGIFAGLYFGGILKSKDAEKTTPATAGTKPTTRHAVHHNGPSVINNGSNVSNLISTTAAIIGKPSNNSTVAAVQMSATTALANGKPSS